MIQFDDHMFQMGCFNHQPVKTCSETIRQFDGTKLDLNICKTRGPGGLMKRAKSTTLSNYS